MHADYVTLGLRHWGDPMGLYRRTKAEQLMILGLYSHLSDAQERAPSVPPGVVASPDAWARANHFRVA